MSAFIVDPEHINVLIWAGRSAVSRSAGRAARELATAGGHLARSPSPFQPSAGPPSLHRGDPPSTCTAAGSPVSARASPGGSAPAAPCGSNGISAQWKARQGRWSARARAQIRFQLFRLVPVDGATPRCDRRPALTGAPLTQNGQRQ
jgi:hypothetical protein